MAGPWRTIDFELFAQLEAVFGTSPGALAGTDAFKCKALVPFKRVIARYDRDKDQGNQASVLSTQKGREKSSWSLAGDLIPSGNAATPTAPDMDMFFEAHLGEKFTCTAHTTTTAGSSGTSLVLTGGGGAASGIRTGGGDLIAVDVDATNGIEVRQVVSRSTDTVVVDRAFSANPATGRNVYVGTTFRLLASALKSLHLWQYLNGDNFRHKTGGNIANAMKLSCDFSSQTPIAECAFSGEGLQIVTHATARPTPTTAGEPLLPTETKVFIGASGKLCAVKAGVDSNNGLMLRESESCSLFPTGVKRTGNGGGRYAVTQDLDLLLVSGIVEGYYDAAAALTAYDVIVQLGVSVGKIVAWRTPKFILDGDLGDQDGEVSLQMKGKCYGLTAVDTELCVAFL
jgi:hypothetical protein